ncbi:MAG: AAA+ family ATPase, partial [Cyanobacteria bacterium P01_H01_bin.119]
MGYLDADSLLQLQQYGYQAASLLVYQSVLDAPPGRAFLALIQALQREEPEAALRAYGQWFSALAVAQQSWQTHLVSQLLRAENPFTRQVQRQGASST